MRSAWEPSQQTFGRQRKRKQQKTGIKIKPIETLDTRQPVHINQAVDVGAYAGRLADRPHSPLP
ncbi:uncharacterized protein Dvir_GJ26420 [Drosophila virilis]|uniref:Uncharacterized protein n=1 Tax=Drosophila virilis TaxID=7244 RepID=A0A0Q9WKU4_DROVI|nr:uncharacterized protein Dvir_GJ26420 [Drosophila virilis]